MNRLRHARSAVPWAAVLAAAIPGSLLLAIGVGFHDRGWAAGAVTGGLLLLAVPAAFLLDDPAAGLVGAVPRSPWWDLSGRLFALGGIGTLIAVAGWAWHRLEPGPQPWLAPLISCCAALLAVGAAAAFRRAGRNTPGDLVSAGLGFLLIGLALFRPGYRTWELLPGAGQAGPGDVGAWLAAAAVALLVLVTAASGGRAGGAVDA